MDLLWPVRAIMVPALNNGQLSINLQNDMFSESACIFPKLCFLTASCVPAFDVMASVLTGESACGRQTKKLAHPCRNSTYRQRPYTKTMFSAIFHQAITRNFTSASNLASSRPYTVRGRSQDERAILRCRITEER